MSFKPYPCDRGIHVAIDVALQLHHALNLSPASASQELASISIICNAITHHEYFGLHAYHSPTHMVEAQFCLPYLVAIALSFGKVGIGDITTINHAILDLTHLIQGQIDNSLQGGLFA